MNLLGNIKTYIKWIPYIIIVVLVISLSVTQCQKQAIVSKVEHVDSSAYYKSKLSTKEREFEKLKEKWSIDSLEMKASEIEYKQLAAKNAKERDKARQNIQHIVNTVPEVKKFVEVDSVSDKATTDRVKEMELEKVEMTTSFFEMLHAKDDELQVSKEFTKSQGRTIVRLEKEVKKQTRVKTVWKITAMVLAGGVVYVAVKD